MSQSSQVRTYDRAFSVVFLKTNERFGGLSNMAPGFPLRVNGVRIRTSEALYQACRFPHLPDVQRKIIDEHSPMTAKMRSKPFRNDSRPDWDAVRVKIMKWCLRIKLAHHWSSFRNLLLDTGDQPIVEQSRKDDFWGAKVDEEGKLVGMNVLGRLLMELREEIKSGIRERSTVVLPLEIPDFLLFDQLIEPVGFGSRFDSAQSQQNERQTEFREIPAPAETAQRSLLETVENGKDARVSANQIAVQSPVPAPHPQTIDGLRPYFEMRPSGLPWLGQVPAHWDVRRNGRLFGSRRETGFPDLPVLEVSLRSGVRVRDFDNGTRKQEMGDRSKYQRAVRGDIAYHMMRMWQGAVGIAPVDGLVSPAYVVARPFAETDTAYYAYVFRTAAYMREVDTFSRGIVPDRNRLYWESFKQMASVYPPLDEQRLIVRFLDWHGAQTAKLIRAKKKIVALLNEQKRAIIHRAVTRGLDPNAELKPSGIPWLGDVPEGWEVRKLRHCGRILGGMTPSMDNGIYWEGSIPWVSPKDMKRREISDSLMHVSQAALDRTSLRLIEPGAVLMVVRGMILARHIPVALTTEPVTINQDMKAIVTEKFVDPEFLCHVLASSQSVLSSLIDESGHGTKRFPTERWREVAFAFPALSDQRDICAWIGRSSHEEDNHIERIEREIALIQEFRTRLIADVVTGKLDVRAAAASLPQVTEIEPADDLGEGDDLDEPLDDAENEEVAA